MNHSPALLTLAQSVLADLAVRLPRAEAALRLTTVLSDRWYAQELKAQTARTHRSVMLTDNSGQAPFFVVLTHPTDPQALASADAYRLEIISEAHGCPMLDVQLVKGALTVIEEDYDD